MADIGDLTHRQTDDLGNKMGGMTGIKRFLSGELVLVERSAQNVSGVTDSSNGGISPYVSVNLSAEAFIADWREFYKQVHSMDMDPSNLLKRLPLVTPGFRWGFWVPRGVKSQRAYEMSEAMFKCWKWTGDRSLDEVIDLRREVRVATKQYVGWCLDRVEADHEMKSTSALQIDERRIINTLTLTERLLLGQWFYWKSLGNHLDVKNVTICPASRCSDGGVPGVGFRRSLGEVYVDGYDPGRANGFLRSRQAVSAG